MSNNIYVNFLPWLTLYQSVTIGKITFWNYRSEADERIRDSQLRERLERHFDSYRSISNSLFPITICSYQGKSFYDNFSEEEFNHLQEAITCLVFASVIEEIEKRIQTEQRHEVPPSINSFDLLSRALNLDSNRYAHVSLSLMDLGLEEGHIVFQPPLGSRRDAFPSGKWIKYLNSYLALKNSSQLKIRISRGLEFFRLAQAQDDLKDNSPEPSFLTRTVLLSIAFESLLDFPIHGKADYFADFINQRFSSTDSRKSSRRIRKNKPKVQYSAVAWWAYDFYKLRNSIVHGNKIVFDKLRFKKGIWFSQMDVASLVFADCLEEILRTKKIIRGKKIKAGKWSMDSFELEDIFESRGVENWKKHHKVLGWIR